jgi:hypothetical protein
MSEEKEPEPTADSAPKKLTVRKVYLRALAEHPDRFKLAELAEPGSGQGIVIVGGRPSTKD